MCNQTSPRSDIFNFIKCRSLQSLSKHVLVFCFGRLRKFHKIQSIIIWCVLVVDECSICYHSSTAGRIFFKFKLYNPQYHYEFSAGEKIFQSFWNILCMRSKICISINIHTNTHNVCITNMHVCYELSVCNILYSIVSLLS